jgi:hypothetical protein
MFEILMGVPQMRDLWNGLKQRRRAKRLSGDEKELFQKLGKAL